MADILVYALHYEGAFNKNSLGAVSEAARVASALGGEAHAVVLGQAAAQRCIALRQLKAKMRVLMLQIAIRSLKQRRRGDELREGIRQQTRVRQGGRNGVDYWRRMRTGQHLPNSFARDVPN